MERKETKHHKIFTDPDEVVTFAQAYYATEFPNSEGQGCPQSAKLRTIALSGTLPNEELRAHLFACSECFRLYRGARLSHSPATVSPSLSWWRRVRGMLRGFAAPRLLAPAGALSLILLIIIGGAPWWGRRAPVEPSSSLMAMNESPQEIVTLPQQSETLAGETPAGIESSALMNRASSSNNTTPTQTLRTPRPPVSNRSSALRVRTVEIDLSEDTLVRGADGGNNASRRVVSLSPERQRFRLRLPEGRRLGSYNVSIVDAFGKTLVSIVARSTGRTLTTGVMDLRELAPGSYRLSVMRGGEAPDYVLIVVSNQARPGM